jgi:hypothetical protein
MLKADDIPSNAIVQEWWSKKHSEEIFYVKSPLPIFLKNGEKAFLQEVAIYDSGRNGINRVIIINPSLQEARLIDNAVKSDISVMDLNNDEISEIEAIAIALGQGTYNGIKTIFNIDGWNLIILHNATIANNEGTYGTTTNNYYAKDVDWKYEDINGDYILDVVETITIANGQENQSPNISLQS